MSLHQYAVGDIVVVDPAAVSAADRGVLFRVTRLSGAHLDVERTDGTGRPTTVTAAHIQRRWVPSGVGHCTPVELEPGMRFRRRPGGGELTFSHVDPAGTYSGRRWVRVSTVGGFAFLCRRDADLIVIDDRT